MTDTQTRTPAATDGSFSWNTMTPAEARAMCVAAQREAGLPHSDLEGGFHLAARYDDVVGVMNEPGLFSSAPTVFRPMAPGVPPFPLLEYDPPQHGPWREIFREVVNPRTVKRLRPQIEQDIDRHLDEVIESGRADLVDDLAEHVPAETICRAAGIDDHGLIRDIRVAALAALNVGGRDPEAFPLRLAEFGEVVLPTLADRRAAPREDFLTRLATAEPDGQPLTEPQLIGAVFGLLAAGHHSTTTAIATLFAHILGDPDITARVRADTKQMTVAIEESLRIDPPFYGFYRRATADTTVAGTEVAADDSVCLSWVGANHDPAVFEDPETFRLDRGANKHLAFGFGIHTCVGAPLARMEMQLALEHVFARMPDVALTAVPAPRYFGGAGATYLDSVPVSFTPGTRVFGAAVGR